MKYFPLFARLEGRRVVVVGGGVEAARKIRLLLKAGARPLVIAPRADDEIVAAAAAGALDLVHRPFDAEDLDGAALLVVSDDGTQPIDSALAAARATGLPVNVIDRPALSTVIVPGIVDRDPILVAIGSAGAAPVLVRRLRERIEALLPSRLGPLADFAGRFRGAVSAAMADGDRRRRFWEHFFDGPIADRVLNGDETGAQEAMLRAINDDRPSPARGSVALIGAGPGDPDLLTVKALRLMQDAEVVVHDALLGDGILDCVRRDADRIDVGKRKGGHKARQEEINEILLAEARAGRRVVRLKGGDPFVFGRGGEEVDHLRRHGIDVQVVPGVTAALGAAAACEIPLTDRRLASSVTFITGHGRDGALDVAPALLAEHRNTVVVYMGVSVAGGIADRMIAAGRRPSTPVAVIERATQPEQRVLPGTLGTLGRLVEEQAVRGPALLVIGDVTAAARSLSHVADFSDAQPERVAV
ncbi:MAG: siroheme synthase CysG [Alphaproteobacteria bacterium]|nr:siroheme synthase CysG [Alphaproteobacteria bacterium]